MRGWKSNIVGGGHRQRHENSPGYRERMAITRDSYGKYLPVKPPYVAVRALFRSMGYIVGWVGAKEKWNVSMRGAWVPFKLRLASTPDEEASITRWLRWVGGEKPQVSDGRDIPRDRVFAFAAASHRRKKLES